MTATGTRRRTWGPGAGGEYGDPPGVAAVRAEYGPAMVARLDNLVRLAEHYVAAQGVDGEDLAREVASAEREQRRYRAEPEAALRWAAAVARMVPREEWDVVPSTEQLRRAWGMP